MVKQLIKGEKARNLAYKKRMHSIKKKIAELETLCGIKACTIVFGLNGEIDSWPENPADVRTMIGAYKHASRNIKTESITETETQTEADLGEKIVRLEREIDDAKKENWRKIMRLMEAMNHALSDRIEISKAADDRQSKSEEKIQKNANSVGKVKDIIGKEPIVVNSEILGGYRNLFGSVLVGLLLNVGEKSNFLSKSDD